MTRRLMEMGLIPGVAVRMVKAAPSAIPLKSAFAVTVLP